MSKGQGMKPSLRESDLQQLREEMEKGRLLPQRHSSQMLCSPRCGAFCQPLQILCFCENTNTLQCVSMQDVDLDHMRRKISVPVVREHSERSKHINN